jgi:hypothetical protein
MTRIENESFFIRLRPRLVKAKVTSSNLYPIILKKKKIKKTVAFLFVNSHRRCGLHQPIWAKATVSSCPFSSRARIKHIKGLISSQTNLQSPKSAAQNSNDHNTPQKPENIPKGGASANLLRLKNHTHRTKKPWNSNGIFRICGR